MKKSIATSLQFIGNAPLKAASYKLITKNYLLLNGVQP